MSGIRTLAGQYKIVDGNPSLAVAARDLLASAAIDFWNKKDLAWAFPYVYSIVTNETTIQVRSKSFQFGDAVLRWIANFYEFYALNLNSWLQSRTAEVRWRNAFSAHTSIPADNPWGARSLAAFLFDIIPHITFDLPRTLAFVFLKFYSVKDNPNTRKKYLYDDFGPDFKVFDNKVFPAALTQVAQGSTSVLPYPVEIMPPGFRDGFLKHWIDLTHLRKEAWTSGEKFATMKEFKDYADKTQTSSVITPIQKI